VATLTAIWDAPLDKNGLRQMLLPTGCSGSAEITNGLTPETGLRNIEVPGIFEGDYLSESGQLTLAGPQVYGQLQLSRI
jgi:hypothetical protein